MNLRHNAEHGERGAVSGKAREQGEGEEGQIGDAHATEERHHDRPDSR